MVLGTSVFRKVIKYKKKVSENAFSAFDAFIKSSVLCMTKRDIRL